MDNEVYVYPPADSESTSHKVAIPPPQPFLKSLKYNLKETFFPDHPLRQFKGQPPTRKLILCLQYFLPILRWAPRYNLGFLKADLVSGLTIASLSRDKLGKTSQLALTDGLYSSFVPPLVYTILGSSRDLAVGTLVVRLLLMALLLGPDVDAIQNPELYLHLAFTATFFASIFQASLGFLRLGFVVDLISHTTIIGFLAAIAIVTSLQQLKGILGLNHFTYATDLVSIMHSIFSQTH